MHQRFRYGSVAAIFVNKTGDKYRTKRTRLDTGPVGCPVKLKYAIAAMKEGPACGTVIWSIYSMPSVYRKRRIAQQTSLLLDGFGVPLPHLPPRLAADHGADYFLGGFEVPCGLYQTGVRPGICCALQLKNVDQPIALAGVVAAAAVVGRGIRTQTRNLGVPVDGSDFAACAEHGGQLDGIVQFVDDVGPFLNRQQGAGFGVQAADRLAGFFKRQAIHEGVDRSRDCLSGMVTGPTGMNF
jgi:hypothetical protein